MTKRNVSISLVIFSLIFLTFSESELHAVGSSGLANPSLGARVGGMANTGIATADDPTTVWFNPAGMVKAGDSFTIGTTLIKSDLEFSGTSGQSADKDDSISNAPHLYAIKKLNDRLGVGLSVNAPFGLKTEWPDNGPFNTVATNSELKMVAVNPSIAYQVNDLFSIAGGLSYFNVSDVTLESRSVPTGVKTLSGDGDGYGYNFGLLLSPSERHSFGLTYRSRVVTEIEGSTKLTGLSGVAAVVFGTNYESPATTNVEFPPSVTFGYTFRHPNEKLLLNFGYEWAGWSTFDETFIHYQETNVLRRGQLEASNPIPRSWRDTSNFAIGGEYKLNSTFAFQAGYFFFDQVIPNRTFNPSIPVNKRHGFSIGTTIAKSIFLAEISYKAIFLDDRSVRNTIGNSTGQSVSGTYEGFASTLGINLTAFFGKS